MSFPGHAVCYSVARSLAEVLEEPSRGLYFLHLGSSFGKSTWAYELEKFFGNEDQLTIGVLEHGKVDVVEVFEG